MTLAPYVDLRAADPLVRAKTYPYANPGRCFLWTEPGYAVLADGASLPVLAGRTPIVGCGSNQSPHQLALKFRDLGLGPIPVLRGRLLDFDSVYAAQVNSYGAIPATLDHAPGTAVTLFVTWLSPAQEKRMHESESLGVVYDYVRLDGVSMELETGARLDRLFAYTARRGALLDRGRPVALAAVPAENRQIPAMTEDEVLALVRDRLAPGRDLDRFIEEAIGDPGRPLRTERTAALAAHAKPFGYRRATVVNPPVRP